MNAPAPAALVLRPYQHEANDAVRRDYLAGIRRLLVNWPTGTGKGTWLGQLPGHLGLWPCLIVVDREELIDQNRRHIERANPGVVTSVEKAELTGSLSADCVLASAPTWMREVDANQRLRRFPPTHFALIINDECHHDASPKRLAILRYFQPRLMVGLTATPFRGDGKPLARIYDKISHSLSQSADDPLGLQRCIVDQWLVPIRAKRIYSNVDITNVRTRQDEFVQDDLAKAVNTDFRNSLVISGIEQHAADRRAILIACVNKSHAEAMQRQLVERGHDADCVLDHTPRETRRQLFADFRAGKKRILVGCGVFSEGTDLPVADTLVFARPVKSPLLFVQLTGRILRPFPGKVDALVLDVADIVGTHRICSVADLFGVRDFDALGGEVMEIAKKAKAVAALGLEIPEGADADSIGQLAEKAARIAEGTIVIDTMADAVELFSAAAMAEEVERDSQFAWVKVSARRYSISLPGPERFVATLYEDALGVWRITNGSQTYDLGTREKGAPFRDADRAVKRWCTDNSWRAIALHARWRAEPATAKQIERLHAMGWKTLPDGLTKGSAAHLLEIFFTAARHRRQMGIR